MMVMGATNVNFCASPKWLLAAADAIRNYSTESPILVNFEKLKSTFSGEEELCYSHAMFLYASNFFVFGFLKFSVYIVNTDTRNTVIEPKFWEFL